jgi:hypothetical protein
MLKMAAAAVLGVQLLLYTTPSMAGYLPIQSDLFTIESTPGVGEWSGNSLRLDLSEGGPLYGGFVQTTHIGRAQLPADIIGISFDVRSTLTNPRVSFSWLVYDASRHGEGQKNLNNYITGSWDLTTWNAQIQEDSTWTNISLGAAYDPFSLEEDFLHNHPLVSLDFRADGWDGVEYLPGTVTFHNIRWLLRSPSDPGRLPLPQSFVLFVTGVLWLAARRRKKTNTGKAGGFPA